LSVAQGDDHPTGSIGDYSSNRSGSVCAEVRDRFLDQSPGANGDDFKGCVGAAYRHDDVASDGHSVRDAKAGGPCQGPWYVERD
jgi:hypothetical protein